MIRYLDGIVQSTFNEFNGTTNFITNFATVEVSVYAYFDHLKIYFCSTSDLSNVILFHGGIIVLYI